MGPARLLGAILAGAVVGLGLRLVLFFAATLTLRAAAAAAVHLLGVPWLDPVYTRAALRSVGDLRIQGLAVAGPLGSALHDLAPGLVLESSRAYGGLVRLCLEPGQAVLGRLVAADLAHAGVLAAGLLVVRTGWQRRRLGLTLAGLALQAQVAVGILAAPPSLREVEATGVSFAANALLPWLAPRSAAVSDASAGLAWPVLEALLVALALLAGYLPAAAFVGALHCWRRPAQGVRVERRQRSPAVVCGVSALAVVLSSATCAGAWVPVPDALPPAPAAPPVPAALAAPAPPPVPPIAPSSPPITAAALTHNPSPHLTQEWDRRFLDPDRTPAAGPSHVEIVGSHFDYQYLVNGQPDVIRGMGLNTQYASQLSPADRRARLDANFTALRALGINTVLGWDPNEFDAVLLDRAQAHDLGVVLPFDLDPSTDFTDPAVRAELTSAVLDWVARYRDAPALRMWGLGNEVLHKIVHPAWVGPQDPLRLSARAFVDWLIETADAVHAADPDHPVTYRSAEDAFVSWVADALRRRGGPRPWFVWGTNCYQDHLADIVDAWPGAGIDGPLWVSEFAPGGLAVPDRPDGFRAMWGYVRRHPEWVLGGAVYAWTRNGPEGVDRNFGLTDDGTPVDGRSLDALAELFQATQVEP